ncbi:hypothetical protein [Jiulongibacter sp. NS-SX5]|uniref:hypothetical protein n=1 Tax=Jiulongibacter sp. NS-SX5 TaxID=3463854 RepID=UPI0040587A78
MIDNFILLRNTLNQINELIKEYHKTLLVLILIVGGTYQIINLMLLGSGFIRYFSLTQLISDGLPAFFVSIILILIFIQIKKRSLLLLKNYSKNRFIIFYVILVLSGLILIFWPNKITIDKFPLIVTNATGLSSNMFNTLVELFFFLSLAYYFFSELFCLKKYIEMEKSSKTKEFDTIPNLSGIRGFLIELAISLLSIPLMVSIFIIPLTILFKIFFSFDSINQEFIHPEQFLNRKILVERVSSKFNSENVSIKYSTDDYVFIEVDGAIMILGIEALIPKNLED